MMEEIALASLDRSQGIDCAAFAVAAAGTLAGF